MSGLQDLYCKIIVSVPETGNNPINKEKKKKNKTKPTTTNKPNKPLIGADRIFDQ